MDTANLTVTDLIVAVAVGLSILGALRRGRGLLAALASGCLVAIASWLVAAVVLAAGPASWQRPVADSAFVHAAHPPVRVAQLIVGQIDPGSSSGPAGPGAQR